MGNDPRRDNQNVDKVLREARQAASLWAHRSSRKRARIIRHLRERIVQKRASIVERVRTDSVKTHAEALISDILPTVELLHYLEDNLPNILKPESRPTPFIYEKSHSRVHYQPRGVVLVIAPWNNPFQLSLVPAISALAAGNAVILKPSEQTPHVTQSVGELFTEINIPPSTFQIVEGDGNLAQDLINSQPDMVFFTGSARNGREVLKTAADNLIPTTAELGGKDPMIVFSDAQTERAIQGALYGAFSHAGQHCVSTKRLYIESEIYETFLDQLTDAARDLSDTQEWGHIKNKGLSDDCTDMIHDALDDGARLLLPDNSDHIAFRPTIVADVDPSMRLVQQETFAPVLVAQSFGDITEAIELANSCPFGLNASVWSRDIQLCEKVAPRIETGNVCANNVLTNIGNPHLPFGGIKRSGIGRYHGPEGVRSFCTTKSVMISKSTRQREPNWFPHNGKRKDFIDSLIQLRHGDLSLPRRIIGWLKLGWQMIT
ncbi:MAG: aldehyde dehydrogenase family protein [Planctomycetota bacterium]